MLLMLKDTPVLEMNTDDFEFTVYHDELLPIYLKSRLQTVPVFDGSIESIKRRNTPILRNIMYVQDFLSQRVLPLSRKNAKKIYGLYGDNQVDKLRISLMCRGVSLLDNYWVKLCNDSILWKDISIRDNPLNEVFTQVALRGSSLSLSGSMTSPETTTDGAYAKGWKRENNDLYLYKKGYESHIEVMVSKLLDNLNIPHVIYEDAEDNSEYCCKCRCMASESVSIVDAGTVEAWCNRQNIGFLPFIIQNYSEALYQMWVVDYLIANSDRHSRNWGFRFDADTTELLGLHPLFDHNNSFDSACMQDPDAPYIANSNMTMRSAAHYAIKRIDIKYRHPFTRDDFMTDRQYNCFMSRLKELGITERSTR